MTAKSNLTGRILVLISFLMICFTCFAQKQTTKYIGINGKLTTSNNAIYMQQINKKTHKHYKVLTYQRNDAKWEKIYSEQYKKLNDSTWQINAKGEDLPPESIRIFSKIADNKWKFKDQVDGQVVRQGEAISVMPLLLDGKVTEYYLGGSKKSVSVYNHNELVSNENWNEDGQKLMDNIFYSADVYPTYSRGNKALHEHIMEYYKKSGLDISSISGKLTVGFVVMQDGTIDGIKLLRGVNNEINKVTLEAFKSLPGNWTPAKLNNEPVRYLQVFPINFINSESHIEYAELRGGILHYQKY
ncbi:MAG: energy transducer TonB [Candidatus Saccharibacteria bacterium]